MMLLLLRWVDAVNDSLIQVSEGGRNDPEGTNRQQEAQ